MWKLHHPDVTRPDGDDVTGGLMIVFIQYLPFLVQRIFAGGSVKVAELCGKFNSIKET